MVEYLKECHGFADEDLTILMDDGKHTPPTSANIVAAYRTLAAQAQPGDALFCHYSYVMLFDPASLCLAGNV